MEERNTNEEKAVSGRSTRDYGKRRRENRSHKEMTGEEGRMRERWKRVT